MVKRFITGVYLSFIGIVGTVIFVLLAVTNPVILNGKDGLMVSIKCNDIMGPFVCFLILAIVGTGMIIYESYIRKE